MGKNLDIVIFGAYGFTGRLIVKHFIQNISLNDVNWACSGRSREKLLALKKEMMTTYKKNNDFEMIIASPNDEKSLDKMLKRTHILINCVGPFMKYSPPVLAACVKNKTNYLDITGEGKYVKLMFEEYSEKAKKAGILMVPCCGLDSIPADIGVYHAMKQLKEKKKKFTSKDSIQVESFVNMTEGISGGTWKTAVNGMSDDFSFLFGKKKTLKIKKKKVVTSKFHKTYRSMPHFSWDMFSFVIPLPTSDPLIIKYSSRILNYSQGGHFSIGHYMVSSVFSAILLLIGVFFMLVIIQFPKGKDFLIWLGHAKGKGPSQKIKDTFGIKFITKVKDSKGTQKMITSTKLPHGAYSATAIFTSECSLALFDLLEKKKLVTGVHTTASAFGDALLDRLAKIDYVWKVEKDIK